MLLKASVARSPDQLAKHVRQKVLVAAVERRVPTIHALLQRADEDASGSLSYKEFYTTLRKLLQLSAAAVTDDAVRATFKVIDKSGDGSLSRAEFATFLRGAETDDDHALEACLDPVHRLAARQAALRRELRLKLLRKRLRKAVARSGRRVFDRNEAYDMDEFADVMRNTLALSLSDADVQLVFRELADGDALSSSAVGRFVADTEKAPDKENDSPVGSRMAALARPKRVHEPVAASAETPWRTTSVEGLIPPLPPSPRSPGSRSRRPQVSPGGRADALLSARDALGRAAEALAASDTAAEDDPAELALAHEQLRQLCFRVAAAADGVATLAATIKRRRSANTSVTEGLNLTYPGAGGHLAKSVSFADDVVSP